MRVSRFYCPGLPKDGEFDLPEAEISHLNRTLRLKPGALIEVFNGLGRAASVRLERVERRRVTGTIIEVRDNPAEKFQVKLAIAPPKGKRLPMLVEKLTELGVDSIQWIETQYGDFDKGNFQKLLPKLQRTSIEACKQCRRNSLPSFPQACSITDLGEFPGLALLASPHPTAQEAWTVLENQHSPRSSLVVIGPEGGLTKSEEEQLTNQGYLPVRLGPLILRVETAAMALGTLLKAHLRSLDVDPDKRQL